MYIKRIHEIILGRREIMSKFFQEGKISLISVREKRETSWYDSYIMSSHTKKSAKLYV